MTEGICTPAARERGILDRLSSCHHLVPSALQQIRIWVSHALCPMCVFMSAGDLNLVGHVTLSTAVQYAPDCAPVPGPRDNLCNYLSQLKGHPV